MNENVKLNGETQMQICIKMLLEALSDKNYLVSDTANHSLRKIAKTYPNEVLKSCCQLSEHHGKTCSDHLANVIRLMEDICLEYILEIDGDTVLIMMNMCVELMTQNSSYEPHVQLPTSGVLVALGKKHCIQIMESLLHKLSPGIIPHYSIPHTMGSLTMANAFGVIPFLRIVLEIMLPLLSTLKTDLQKQTFSFAFGCFSEGLMEYVSNLEQAPDPTITISDFHLEMSLIYETLFPAWLNTRDLKLLETVLCTMASIFKVLGNVKITYHTVKTIQVLLNLYRKHKDPLPIVKCLGTVISVSGKTDGTLLEPLLGPIMQALSELICVAPDYAQPELLRTHSEVLRCFECLAMHYSDTTVDQVVAQLNNNNDRERVKGLLVLTHLTNSAESVIRSRLNDCLQVLINMLAENNLRTKMTLMKVIVAFSYKGFLNNQETVTEKFMLFIIKLCRRQINSKEADCQDISELQMTADNTLYMLTTSVKDLESSLWNLLLQCLLSQEYYEASIIILRCLTHMASRKKEISTCEEAFVRCITLLAQPLPNFKGNFVLNFLKTIRPCEKDAYRSVWDQKVTHLLKYLEQNYDCFNEKEWEDLIFDFLSLLIESVKDEVFNLSLTSIIRKQLLLYTGRSFDINQNASSRTAEKRSMIKCLATISCYTTNKKLIQQIISIILENMKPQDQQELLSCAEAIGICSRSNLKLVLEMMQEIRKSVLLKKSNKLMFQFSFIRDQRNELESERIRYLIIASYAEICNEAPADILLQTIENDILQFTLNELALAKDFTIRKICLKTIGAVADAMHPNRNKLHINMQDRDHILKMVLAQLQLHSGPEYIELFPIIIPVLTSLVRLPHVPESEQRLQLLKLCFDTVFNASAIYCKISADGYGDLKLAPHVYTTFLKINTLVQELLLQCLSPATLDEIVTLLEPWLRRKKVEQRLPSLETLRVALQTYLDNMKFAYEGPSTFGQTGFILAKIVPRCTDPNKAIRKVAVECVCLMLCIANRYEGHMREHDKVLNNAFAHIQEQIETNEPKQLFNLTTDLAHTIALNIPKFQLVHFVDALIDGLLDVEKSCSSGASIVLNNVMKLKGNELQNHVHSIIGRIHNVLDKINCPRTKSTTLSSVFSLTEHNLKQVVQVLLQQTLPYDQSTCSCWMVLTSDQEITIQIIEYLKKSLKNTALYEEQNVTENIQMATLNSLQVIAAFNEIFKGNKTLEIYKQQFSELFSTLYITLASYIGTIAPVHMNVDKRIFVPNRDAYKLSPFKICLDAFKLFLQNSENTQAAVEVYLCSESMSSFLSMVPKLVENICKENAQSLSFIVTCFGPYIRSDFEPQRIAVSAFFAYLLQHKVATNHSVLMENILEMLLDIQNDTSFVVKKISLLGLGNAAEYLSIEHVSRHCNVILNAFMQGLNYNSANEFEVVLEAMLGFSKLLNVVDQKHLKHSQVTAAVRIKPLLQHENPALREASFRLLGNLADSIGPDDAFKEQINGNLIALLLHLCDDDAEVVKGCKHTMRKIAPFLECPKVSAMIQEHLIEEAQLQFNQFVTDLIKAMAENVQELFIDLIMTCLAYFKSPWTQIRGNAALITGLLISQLGIDARNAISIDTVSYRLLQLLKDDQPEVRAKAIEAIALIFVV